MKPDEAVVYDVCVELLRDRIAIEIGHPT